MLRLTPATIKAIEDWLAKVQTERPVLAVVRARKLATGDSVWSLAIYERENVPESEIFELEGYDFYVDNQWQHEASQMVIDYKKGRFVFVN